MWKACAIFSVLSALCVGAIEVPTGITGDITCTKLQASQAPFCHELVNYDVSSIVLSDSAQRDYLAKLGMTSSELTPKCSFYATKHYNCRKYFPPCVNQVTDAVREHLPVQHNHPYTALKDRPPAVIQYKICRSSCLAAKDLSSGACKFFAPSYFEAECSQQHYYSQTDELCEFYGVAPLVDKNFSTRLIISTMMGLIGLVIALSTWRNHRQSKSMMERLEQEAQARDTLMMKQRKANVDLDLALREMQKYKYGRKMVDDGGAETTENGDYSSSVSIQSVKKNKSK